jgi:hypothetical protein
MKLKGKVIPVLKHHAMNIFGGMEMKLHTFLMLVRGGGE